MNVVFPSNNYAICRFFSRKCKLSLLNFLTFSVLGGKSVRVFCGNHHQKPNDTPDTRVLFSFFSVLSCAGLFSAVEVGRLGAPLL